MIAFNRSGHKATFPLIGRSIAHPLPDLLAVNLRQALAGHVYRLPNSIVDDYLPGATFLHDYLPLTRYDDHLATTWTDRHLPFTWRDIDLPSARADVQCAVRVDCQHPVAARELAHHWVIHRRYSLIPGLSIGHYPASKLVFATMLFSARQTRSSRLGLYRCSTPSRLFALGPVLVGVR